MLRSLNVTDSPLRSCWLERARTTSLTARRTLDAGGRHAGRGRWPRPRWAILWERLWPALASLATAIGLFLACRGSASGCGCRRSAVPSGCSSSSLLTRCRGLPLLRLRLPSAFDGLRRLDRSSRLPHRPATAIADGLRAEPTTRSRVRCGARMSSGRCAPRTPSRPARRSPRLPLRDPFALRALVLMLVFATFFAAGGERVKRITAAFDWAGVVAPANFRIDAWVTPPAYTGKPPVILPGLRPGEPHAGAASAAGDGAGRQRAGDPRQRPSPARSRDHGRPRGGEADEPRRRRRRAPRSAASPSRRPAARPCAACCERRHLDLHRHAGPAADDRAHQGSGAAGARRAAARLQDRGRLRRRRRAGELRAQGVPRAGCRSRRVRCSARRISR